MIFLLISTVIFCLLIVNWRKLYTESKRLKVNGPLPLPVIGNANLFIVKTTEFGNLLHRLSIKYGQVYRVHLLSTPYIVICHAKYAEAIVTSSELITKGRSYSFLHAWLGNGLLTSTGQRWKTHRKFLTPAFHFNILQNFLPVFCKNQRKFTQKLRSMADGQAIDVVPLIALAALDNVTESIMGVCVNAQENSKSDYVQSIEVLSSIVSMRMQIPLLGEDMIFNLLPHKRRQDKALECVHGHAMKVISARRQELNKANITRLDAGNDIGIKNKQAFLDLLLLGEIDGEKIDDVTVREEVDTFMFEGHDTSTSGMVFTLYCLSKHRDVQEKIYKELQSIFGDDMERDPTYNELQQMKYLDLVLKESMRLYPPVPLVERKIMNDCVAGEMNLIKGTTVLLNIFEIQRNEDLFDDPLEFKPERFEMPLKSPFSWLAFSAGPRNCIGQKFAIMALKVSISEIIKNFVVLPCDMEPELSMNLVLRSTNGLHVRLQPRNQV